MRGVWSHDRGKGATAGGWAQKVDFQRAERRLLQFFLLVRAARDLEKLCNESCVKRTSASSSFYSRRSAVFRRRIGPELNDLHIFGINFYLFIATNAFKNSKGRSAGARRPQEGSPKSP